MSGLRGFRLFERANDERNNRSSFGTGGSWADLRFPTKTDRRLQYLMDRNTEGLLTPQEREELESLVELNETMSLLRTKALIFWEEKQALHTATFPIEHIIPVSSL